MFFLLYLFCFIFFLIRFSNWQTVRMRTVQFSNDAIWFFRDSSLKKKKYFVIIYSSLYSEKKKKNFFSNDKNQWVSLFFLDLAFIVRTKTVQTCFNIVKKSSFVFYRTMKVKKCTFLGKKTNTIKHGVAMLLSMWLLLECYRAKQNQKDKLTNNPHAFITITVSILRWTCAGLSLSLLHFSWAGRLEERERT